MATRTVESKGLPVTDALARAAADVPVESLRRMVLDRSELPPQFRDFEVLREGVLDNATLAEQGFPGSSEAGIQQYGRTTGYLKEYVSSAPAEEQKPGADVAVATVVHLFRDKDAVSSWMDDIFLRQFEQNVGAAIGKGQTLEAVDRLPVKGFHDRAVGLRALQKGPHALLSSTVVDFRVERLLGVAYVITMGDFERRSLCERVARDLERQIVRVLLGGR